MKKIYNILCGLLVLILLVVGVFSLFDKDPTFSETENRDLLTFPRITISGLIDGGFTTALQEYYVDTFPGRETLAQAYEDLEGFYTFGGSPEETPES